MFVICTLNIYTNRHHEIVCFEVIHNNITIVLVVNSFDNILFLLEIGSCQDTF